MKNRKKRAKILVILAYQNFAAGIVGKTLFFRKVQKKVFFFCAFKCNYIGKWGVFSPITPQQIFRVFRFLHKLRDFGHFLHIFAHFCGAIFSISPSSRSKRTFLMFFFFDVLAGVTLLWFDRRNRFCFRMVIFDVFGRFLTVFSYIITRETGFFNF